MSPTLFREHGFRFYFFANEEARMHVHVLSGDGEAKFWLEPEIALAHNERLSRVQLTKIKKIIEAHHEEIASIWNLFFRR